MNGLRNGFHVCVDVTEELIYDIYFGIIRIFLRSGSSSVDGLVLSLVALSVDFENHCCFEFNVLNDQLPERFFAREVGIVQFIMFTFDFPSSLKLIVSTVTAVIQKGVTAFALSFYCSSSGTYIDAVFRAGDQ